MQQPGHLEIKKQLEEIISVMERQVETAKANKQRLDLLIEKQKETAVPDTIGADKKKTLLAPQDVSRAPEEAPQEVSISLEEMTLEEYESSSSAPKPSRSRLRLVAVAAALSFLLIGSIVYSI